MAKDSSLKAVGWARSLPLNSGVKEARDWTREHLATLDWAQKTPEVMDDVLLTVSELVTNAHVHARSAAQLILTWDEECLHVTVHDSSPRLPEQRDPDDGALGGRGLMLIDALSDEWHAYPCPRGKNVTACFQPPMPATTEVIGSG
ncbi:ATP-binding protein [Streptomyces sp. ASQP_92]|uniref:ATP-binding protein n=1 Tax=Streptomyces sp. ASQP_92 TaxID=2979116 RepID=UPI0021C21C2E|nr:ATP-binding protein [Streptomyces sp. ASQP_92]MCT9092493.1 ATP-binding protein [Streptomyces sp. ASQP_92]